jgi:hypothetical protein
MYSLPGHDIHSLTHIIAGSANGRFPAHDLAHPEIGCSSVLGCQRDEQIAIRNYPNHATIAFDNGERAAAFVPHLLTRRSRVRSRRAGGHILRHNLPNLHGSTPFGGFRCPAGRLATFFEAEGNQKGSGSLKDPSLYRAPAPSSCALGAAPSRVLKSGARRS